MLFPSSALTTSKATTLIGRQQAICPPIERFPMNRVSSGQLGVRIAFVRGIILLDQSTFYPVVRCRSHPRLLRCALSELEMKISVVYERISLRSFYACPETLAASSGANVKTPMQCTSLSAQLLTS
jgi:hypothetical protein